MNIGVDYVTLLSQERMSSMYQSKEDPWLYKPPYKDASSNSDIPTDIESNNLRHSCCVIGGSISRDDRTENLDAEDLGSQSTTAL